MIFATFSILSSRFSGWRVSDMARTFRGVSMMKDSASHRRGVRRIPSRSHHILEIEAMHGEVHRFEGVVARFGSMVKSTGITQTVCVRDLRLCRTGQYLNPDHWWFPLRAEWMALCLMPGDRVVFTAKVQRCSKGLDDPGIPPEEAIGRKRRQVMGFSRTVRDLLLKSRAGWS